MNSGIYIRKVNTDDVRDVFLNSNQDYVRKYSINKEKINWEDHIIWFENTLKDVNCVFYIITDNINRFLGQIRYKIENETAVVSISLSELIRGKGNSNILLSKSMYELFGERDELKSVVAYISEKNIPSLKLFERVGFRYCSKKEDFLKYVYRRKVLTYDNR